MLAVRIEPFEITFDAPTPVIAKSELYGRESVAGELNPTVGGPGFHDFTTFVFNSQFYDILAPIGTSFHRRSLYRTWVRSGRIPFLEVLDGPDPSTKTPRRAVTTTPLQALSLLNSSEFVYVESLGCLIFVPTDRGR